MKKSNSCKICREIIGTQKTKDGVFCENHLTPCWNCHKRDCICDFQYQEERDKQK